MRSVTQPATTRRSALPSVIRAVAVFAAVAGTAQGADPLGDSIGLQGAAIREAARSQEQIDRTYEQTRDLVEEYKATLRELESLRRYDDHIGKMVTAQESSIASLQAQLGEIDVTHREIVPLMGRVVESIGQFVELDLPFLLDERRGRVRRLTELIDDPQASLADKYRQIMEAYQIETEYVRTVEAYRGNLTNGVTERTVHFLRVGRIALIYRSLDGTRAGAWDPSARAWSELPDSYRSSLGKGFRIARKQAAPDLLKLPVPAPKAQP